MRSNSIFRRGILATTLCLATGVAPAQPYPNKPVRVVVPFAAGSATDTIARTYAQKVSELLGQPAVVDNKPGANGQIGAENIAKSAPDGYSILIGTNSTNAALKSLHKKLPYDQDTAFAPAAYLGSVPLIVAVNNDLPIKTLADLIAMAKAKPGQVSFASASTSQRVATEMLAGMAGIKLLMVPYKSSPNAVTDLMSGQVMMFTADFAVTLAQVKAGKIRGLAVTASERSASIPELPTVAEAGGLKGYELIAWFGAFAPAGTPTEIVARLNEAFNAASNDATVKSRLGAMGIETRPTTPQVLAEYVKSETVKWAKAIKDAGIEPE